MKNMKKIVSVVILAVLMLTVLAITCSAEGEVPAAGMSETGVKALASAIVVGVTAVVAAAAMGLVIYKTIDGITRQPEAEGKIRTGMMLGLVFIETLVIYALIVAILLIFVL